MTGALPPQVLEARLRARIAELERDLFKASNAAEEADSANADLEREWQKSLARERRLREALEQISHHARDHGHAVAIARAALADGEDT